MTTWKKYASGARRWSEEAYADSASYLAARAAVIRGLGPRLAPGDVVLDLACGDGGLAEHLPELRYVGVDASPEMVAAGRSRGRQLVEADLNEYEPAEPVQATTVFRAIYYARDRREFFLRVASFTEKKLVFDLNPRQFALADVTFELRSAGFDSVETRPFFVSQTRALPRPMVWMLRALERVGPLASLVLRYRFTLICAASKRGAS